MAERDEGGASAGAADATMSEDERSPEGLEDNMTLSFLDKLKCMMYSKVERDAFLIEKLEKEEKKKAKLALSTEDGKKKKKKATLFDKLKSVFSTPEEQHEFLQRQVDELEQKNQQSQSAKEGAGISGDAVATPL